MITLTAEQAQQIEEIVEHLLVDHPTARHHKACVEALSIIRAARAQEQAEQEPVALIEECREALAQELMAYDIDPPIHHVKQAHDKCVAWLFNRTAPVQQVDLSDDEIKKVCADVPFVIICPEYDIAFARAVIAAYKEKNRG